LLQGRGYNFSAGPGWIFRRPLHSHRIYDKGRDCHHSLIAILYKGFGRYVKQFVGPMPNMSSSSLIDPLADSFLASAFE
jgi:hypothetical protein